MSLVTRFVAAVACSIILNFVVAFEQKLKLYVGLVMLHAVCCCRNFPDNFRCLSALSKINVLSPHFQTMSPVAQNPWKAP